MADFPQNAVIFDTDPTWTADMARPEFEKWLNATLQLLGAREPESLTIATGQIAPTRAMVIVDTEGQAATDDLATIAATDLHSGAVVMLRAADPGRVVTVIHGTGTGTVELLEGATRTLSAKSWLILRRTGDRWVEFRPAMPDATTSASGLLSAADKQKLDELSAGGEKVSSLSGTAPAIGVVDGITIRTWSVTAASTPTISLSSGQSVSVVIVNPSGHAIDWPSSVKWRNGELPPATPSATTIVELLAVGSSVYGSHGAFA